ncbi:nucleotidyltransferase domain-containing protein [Flindersiella endophytica]
MFTAAEREQLRDSLVAAARTDPRITAAALTGSAAAGREDAWSDIDLAFRLADAGDLEPALAAWTERMYREHSAVHHLDVLSGRTVFRVFLLASTLQVDVAFWPPDDFGATGPTFRLLFGAANERPAARPPAAAQLVGTGWLYALHARSSIARGRRWQAEYMLSGMRNQVIGLACLRHGLPSHEGRGVDALPREVTDPLTATLTGSLDDVSLRRAFAAIAQALLAETAHADAELAARLRGPLEAMIV